jgi:AcrR family transcriptional regulator
MMSRNRRSDGDITKARILDAAGNLIAQHGFAQTSNKAIAQAANVDLAAINYHFKGRKVYIELFWWRRMHIILMSNF